MKRIISLVLAVLMLMCTGILAFAETDALTLADGLDALNSQFAEGKGPETNGYEIDYHYFSPVKEGDTQKYPLVIWLHGMGDGGDSGKQVEKSQIGYWSSQEFQSRFGNAQGAFIFAPRSPEEKLMFWDDTLIYPLRAAIDAFIEENAENIDISKIYIGGYSMGGKMTLKMAVAYPDMFAAIFPICPAWTPSEAEFELISDIPLWLTSGKTDPLINYTGSIVPLWDTIKATNNAPENCRLSTLEKVKYADGSSTSSGHHAWFSVSYDMFSLDNGDYPDMKTVNGIDEDVVLTYPDGMISWLSQFSSDFDGAKATDSGNITVEDGKVGGALFDAVEEFIAGIRRLFEKIMKTIQDFFKF